MLRKALFIIAFAALACGRQDSASTTPTDEAAATPPVSAVQPSDTAAAPAPTVETVSCLELVSVGKYPEAVVVCQTAASQDPSNTEVAAALAKANAAAAANSAAAAGDAAADANAAAGAAADSAASAAESADEKAAD